MATLSLKRGSTTVDLIGGTDGVYLAHDGWAQGISHTDGLLVNEVLTLDAEGTNATNLAARFNAVSDMIRALKDRNRDRVAPDPTWLRAKLDGMSTTRQAVIEDAEAAFSSTLYSPPTRTAHVIPRWTLAITRHPWERTSTTNLTASVTNGSIASVGTPTGTHKGRIWRTRVQTSGAFTRMWWGFRTNRYGTRSNFVPTWNCTDGTALNGATDDGTDIVWAGTDTAMAMRLRFEMSQVSGMSGNYSDQRGRHLVLLVASVTHSSSTFYVKLADGFRNSANWYTRDPVLVDQGIHGTAIQVFPIGTVQIPPAPLRDTAASNALLNDYALAVYAQEATDGSGSLKMRYLILIPQSEGACYVDGVTVANASNTVGYVYTEADGEYSAFSSDGASVTNSPDDFQVTDYWLPTDPCSVVFVGTHNTSGYVPTRTATLNFLYYPRWAALAP